MAAARSVDRLASTIRELVAGGGRWRDVEALLVQEDLPPEDRIALVVALLDDPATADPHPADVVVHAFVAMRMDDFTLRPQAVDVREVVDLWLDLTGAEVEEATIEERRRR